jgi:predicted GIY-YIG superfamily endonuclease
MMCIYGILFENGKWYVGRTNDFNRRKSEHLSDYRNPNVSDYESEKYRAMRKYEFEFVILEEVKEENLLPEREKY